MNNSHLISKSYFYVYCLKCPFMVAYYLELDNKKICFAFLLTLIGWLPGVVYALYLVKEYYNESAIN